MVAVMASRPGRVGVADAEVAAQGALELDVLGGVADAEEQVGGGGVGSALEARGPERGGAFLDRGRRSRPSCRARRAARRTGRPMEGVRPLPLVSRWKNQMSGLLLSGSTLPFSQRSGGRRSRPRSRPIRPPLFVVLDHGLDALVGELVELLPQRLVELCACFCIPDPSS